MLNFTSAICLPTILVTGMMLCGQEATACGAGRARVPQATCSAHCHTIPLPATQPPAAPAVAPGDKAAPSEMQMDHAGHSQATNRIRYQSAFQAPAVLPQYAAPVQQYRSPTRNYDLRNDPQYQYRADRKIRGF
jgi:hypothetical protein